jgi:threonine dehydratase
VFLDSPHYDCEPLGDALGCRVVPKVETLNPVRSFKGRGTETVLARLPAESPGRGVVCASAGNLGQALAYGARRLGIAVAGASASRSSSPAPARWAPRWCWST